MRQAPHRGAGRFRKHEAGADRRDLSDSFRSRLGLGRKEAEKQETVGGKAGKRQRGNCGAGARKGVDRLGPPAAPP